MKYIAFILFIFLSLITGLILASLLFHYYEIEQLPIPIAIDGTLDYFNAETEIIGAYIGSAIIGILLLFISVSCYSWYHRLCKKKKNSYANNITAPYCLYLRSFKDEAITRKSIGIHTEEEALVRVLSEIAPVYAIGDPQDKKMPLGASRIYVSNEEWKSVVFSMSQDASVVALRLGETDSFWWEVEMALINVPIEKILFIIPTSKTFNNVAYLYKILLSHNIDISKVNISVEKKRRGSISSFLYFDNDGTPNTAQVRVPKILKLILSYENILSNALQNFRLKFGISLKKKHTIRYARVMQGLYLFAITFMPISTCFSDLIELRYQMPYELVERCVQDDVFRNKYSDEVNGNNLVYSIIEAKKGVFLLENEMFLEMIQIEMESIKAMDYDEFEQLMEERKNELLMIKKYCPESYGKYVSILESAAKYSLYYPTDTEEYILAYKGLVEYLPQWVNNFYEENSHLDEYEFTIKYFEIIEQHFNDEDIADVLKVLLSTQINI